MDVCRGLRWISASNMMLWHHFHPTSDFLKSQIWGQLGWWNAIRAPICLRDSIPMAQTFCICRILIWMYEVVWGGYRPQPWCYEIIFTPHTQSRIPRSVANSAGVTVCVPPCPWDSIPMAEALCIYLICMYEVVRGGYQPQTRCNVIIYIPPVSWT